MTDTTNSSSDLSGVLRRVQKLLAMANDGRGNPEEAAAAASMAEKIMRKYQLEHADVIQAELKSGAGLIWKAVFANMKRDDPKRPPLVKNPMWGQFLAVAIAQLHDCAARQGRDTDKHGTHSASLRFYGYSADVEMCAFTFDYLVGVVIRALKERQKAGIKDRTANEAYRKGFVSALTQRIADLGAEKEREQQQLSGSRALVVSKQRAIAEQFGETQYKTKRTNVKDYGAYAEGARDGRKVDLNVRGVGSSGSGSPTIAIR